MSGNSIGKLFCVTTAGESHGKALVAIVDGCPPNLELSEADIQIDLDRRKPGTSKFTTQRKESDAVEILSGVYQGKTTGTPIALLIRNLDQKSKDYSAISAQFRPGHADYTYWQKYGVRDPRGGGRSSARETAMRVAAGAIAKKYLAKYGIKVRGFMSQIGTLKLDFINWQTVAENPFFCADACKVAQIASYIDEIRKQQDSIGAQITVVVDGVTPGLGEPVFAKLDAELAYALMGINAVKAVEIGAGIDCIKQKGSAHRDEISSLGFNSNNAGGILGGISTGQQIIIKLAFKPTPSISLAGKTIDIFGNDVEITTKGRHDPCVGLRATPIAEAMTAIVLMDHFLRNRAQNADIICNTPQIQKTAAQTLSAKNLNNAEQAKIKQEQVAKV